jgi:hypothetical protein
MNEHRSSVTYPKINSKKYLGKLRFSIELKNSGDKAMKSLRKWLVNKPL